MKKIPHLHTMTEYSFLESTIKIDSLISLAKKEGLKSLAITDHNNMYGVAEFVHKCNKEDIKPIVGVDLDIEDGRLILIAKNYSGFLHIVSLVSKKNFGNDINFNDIDEKDIIIIDHPEYGFIKRKGSLPFNQYFFPGDETKAKTIKVDYIRYLNKEDRKDIDLVDSIKEGETVSGKPGTFYETNLKFENPSVKQLENIVNQIDIKFPKNLNPIPEFKKGIDSKKLFTDTIKKYATTVLKENIKNRKYIERLKLEVNIINKLNFENYFLIIWDLIKWSKENNIIIGPGRGSAAGSLVSYILGITEIDPIKHDLLFERFLNPERVTMPDIDIDIEDEKRELVINYLFDKYGKLNVAYISTFQKLAAKSSLRDIGRLMGIPAGDVIEITKLIPNLTTLKEAYKQQSRFRAVIDSNEKNTLLYNRALVIEGLPRQLGTHAAGIVVANKEIASWIPTTKSSEGRNQVQYSMDFLEENGLLKIDLLGLRNLTILNDIQKEIFSNHKKNIMLSKIPTNDQKTNDLLTKGDTNGIFQLESHGMKNTLKKIRASSIDDVTAIISLFRPGPMEYIDEYSEVKNGKRKIKSIGPIYDKIVKPTHGIIVYQEQIMQIAQGYANMSFGRADILRRAIGKKKIDLMNSLKKEFIQGSIDNNHTKEQAEEIFKLIQKFADYGFNKSHAVAYATLAYRMAYLKAWFPYEFYTALIKSSSGSLNSLRNYIFEAKKRNIEIMAPDINLSRENVYNKKPHIILPLAIIKGLGAVANSKILDERKENGEFKNYFEFIARMKKIGLSDSIITSLIKSNSLRKFGYVTNLLDTLPQALRYAEMVISTKDGGKVISDAGIAKPKMLDGERNINLEIKYESDIFGFNISLFKTSPYEVNGKKLINIDEKGKEVIVLVKKIKSFNDKNGNEMGIVELQDSSSIIEVFIFHNIFKYVSSTKKNVIVKASISLRNGRYSLNKEWEVINE